MLDTSGVSYSEILEAQAMTAMESSNLYAFLSMVFRDALSAPALRQIRSPAFVEALSEAGVELDAEFLQRPEAALLEDLAVEYAALFVGPGGHISPYESVQTEGGSGQLWGTETVEVRRFIEAAGFAYKPDFHDLPDHISVELDFMSELARREAAAWRSEDFAAVLDCLRLAKKFLSRHLGNWAPVFCAKVAARAEHPFYREMAQLTADFLRLGIEDVSRPSTFATA